VPVSLGQGITALDPALRHDRRNTARPVAGGFAQFPRVQNIDFDFLNRKVGQVLAADPDGVGSSAGRISPG